MLFPTDSGEIAEKTRRIQAFLAERDFAGVLLSGKRNFAWATGGRDNHVVKGSDGGVGYALFAADGGKYFLCNNIEEARFRNEERLEEQGFRFITGAWYSFSPAAEAAKIVGAGTLASDIALPGAKLTLLSDGEMYAQKLQEAGVPVTYQRFNGVTHEFFGAKALLDEAASAIEQIGRAHV